MSNPYEWRKPSRSGSTGNCVEVAQNIAGIVAVRDSKDPDGPQLVVTSDDWRAFAAGLRTGEFDIS
jgi:hypothetical protein